MSELVDAMHAGAAVLQAAQAIGHLIVLGLLAAAVAVAFQGGRKWERRRPQLRIRPRARASRKACQKPPAAPVEAPAATLPLVCYGQDKLPLACYGQDKESTDKRPDRDSLLADPRSGRKTTQPAPVGDASPAHCPFMTSRPAVPVSSARALSSSVAPQRR